MPQRIQRQRTAGWRMPRNTVYVGRPTMFGNPYPANRSRSHSEAVACYRSHLRNNPDIVELAQKKLRGKNLACWCKPSDACHADILLDIANQDSRLTP